MSASHFRGFATIVGTWVQCNGEKSGADAMDIHRAPQCPDGATIRLLMAHGVDAKRSAYNTYFNTPILVATTQSSNAATVSMPSYLSTVPNIHVTFGVVHLLHISKDAEICTQRDARGLDCGTWLGFAIVCACHQKHFP